MVALGADSARHHLQLDRRTGLIVAARPREEVARASPPERFSADLTGRVGMSPGPQLTDAPVV